jgi:hypothetical protein
MHISQSPVRPRRYPRDRAISTIVDLLAVKAAELANHDDANAARLDQARQIVLDVALGVPRGERAA